MNMKYRSVLAVGMSVAMMVQAPVVAFATEPEPVVSVVAENPSPETTENPTEVTVTDGVGAEVTVVNEATLENYGDAYVTISERIATEDTNKVGLYVNSTATTGNENTPNNLNVTLTGNINIQDNQGHLGTAIKTEGQANVYANSSVIGNIDNEGSGDIIMDPRGYVIGNVTNGSNASGDITVNGTVEGNIVNAAGITTVNGVIGNVNASGGKVIIVGVLEGNVTSGAANVYTHSIYTNSGINSDLNYLITKGNGINYRGVYNSNDFSLSNLNDNNNYQDKTVYTGPTKTDGTYNSYEYAKKDDILIFTVASGYEYRDLMAEPIDGAPGYYRLRVPVGGNVHLTAYQLQQISDKIKEETGSDNVVITTDSASDADVNVSSGTLSQSGINIVTTSAGADLPRSLGVAPVATKSVSLDISKITPAQLRDTVVNTVSKTPEGGAFLLETNEPSCLDKNMIEAFAARPDVSISIVFKHAGLKKRVIIPAGYNVKELLDANGYCGFLKLAQILGFTILE